jgi:hypothetical protein
MTIDLSSASTNQPTIHPEMTVPYVYSNGQQLPEFN